MKFADQRVLFFSPYASWCYHTALEVTWAHALRLRGADVRFLVCDSQLPACDIYRANLNPRDEVSCLECQARVSTQFAGYGMPYEWLGQYVPRAVRARVRSWVEAIPAEELLEAEWEGRPVGRWASTSAYYQFRTSKLKLDEPEVERMVRALLVGTVHVVEGMTVLLDEYQPTSVATLNGRFFAHWAVVELTAERGIRLVTHERGLRKNTVRFAENHRTHELDPMRELWSLWGDIPLSQVELEYISGVIDDRRRGLNYSSFVFSPPVDGASQPTSLREHLGFDEGPLVAVFNSSDDETAAFADRCEGAFPVARDFLPATLELARSMPDVQFAVRMHPNIQSKLGANEDQLAQAAGIRDTAPSNVRVIMPDEDVSSYLLMDTADVGVVYASTAGLEMAARGTPVLCMAKATYSHTGCVRQVDRPEDFAPALVAAFESRGREVQVECARRALRWACRYFQHFAIPFDLVRELPEWEAELTYQDTSALLPHLNPTLDEVCEKLVGAAPVVPRPTADELARSRDAEDLFLNDWLAPLEQRAAS